MATRAFHPTLPHPRCYGRAGGRAVGQPREVREQQSDSEMLRNGACSQPPQPQGNQGSWRTETQQRTKRTRVVRQCCHQEGCSNSHHIRQLLEGTDSDQHLSKPTQSPSTACSTSALTQESQSFPLPQLLPTSCSRAALTIYHVQTKERDHCVKKTDKQT